jgi:hypothetical protein
MLLCQILRYRVVKDKSRKSGSPQQLSEQSGRRAELCRNVVFLVSTQKTKRAQGQCGPLSPPPIEQREENAELYNTRAAIAGQPTHYRVLSFSSLSLLALIIDPTQIVRRCIFLKAPRTAQIVWHLCDGRHVRLQLLLREQPVRFLQ